MFHSVAQAITALEKKKRVHTQVRAACVAHLQRHSEKYEQYWDRLAPSEQESPMGSWKEYLDALSQRGAWGGYLELSAIASTLGLRITVCHSSGQKHYFNREAPTRIWIAYESTHYLRLKGSCTDVSEVEWQNVP